MVDMGLFLCGVIGVSWVGGAFEACKGKRMAEKFLKVVDAYRKLKDNGTKYLKYEMKREMQYYLFGNVLE